MVDFRGIEFGSKIEIFAILMEAMMAVSIGLSAQPPHSNQLHCDHVSSAVAVKNQRNLDANYSRMDEFSITSDISADILVGQTLCFQLFFDEDPGSAATQNGSTDSIHSILYSFSVVHAEQHYPVRQSYQFGVPSVAVDCFCDCPGGTDHCSGHFRYSNCSVDPSTVCYRIFHPHQSPSGCQLPGEAEMCCKIKLQPIASKPLYTALEIGQPETVLRLSYKLFILAKTSADQFNHKTLLESKTFIVSENKDHEIVFQATQKILIFLTIISQMKTLPEGTYYTPMGQLESKTTLFTGLPINSAMEWSLQKLGWFRFNQSTNSWFIRNGRIKLQRAHSVHALNCQLQQYSSTFDMEFYSTKDSGWSPPGGVNVKHYYRWISDIFIAFSGNLSLPADNIRHVILRRKKLSRIRLGASIQGAPRIVFGQHGSYLKDFDGVIQLDKYSNNYLNITFLSSSGTIICQLSPLTPAVGPIYPSSSPPANINLTFTIHINNLGDEIYNQIYPLPSTIKSDQWLCIHPQGFNTLASKRICKLAKYHAVPQQHYFLFTTWEEKQGTCEDCNKIGPTQFLQYLDPRKWLDGLNSTPETIAAMVEIAGYILLLIVIVCLLRCFIIPVLKWSLCDTSSSPKRNI